MGKTLGALTAGLIVLAAAAPSRADDQTEAMAVVDKAIKAMGGADRLARSAKMTWSETGTYYGMGEGLPYTGHYAIQWPDRFRMEIKDVFLMVLNGDKGWVSMGGETTELSKEQMAENQEGHHGSYLTTLLPLKDKAVTLTPLKEIKVGDRPAVGVKASSKGHRDVSLYFDKETGLLVKSEMRVKPQELGGKEVNQESWYSEHKEVGGLKVPMKLVIHHDGKKFLESTHTDLKFPDKLDDKLFAKP
jgi:hypothetical protein